VAALSEGHARPTSEFRRYGPEQLREAFAAVSTPNVSDAMHRAGALADLHSVVPGRHMVGRALTVRTYPGDWAKPVEAIDLAQPGDVLVIDAGSRAPRRVGRAGHRVAACSASWRAWSSTAPSATWTRSAPLAFPAFARVQCPNAWEPKGFGEIGTPVIVGGVRVSAGDWIVGDDSGRRRPCPPSAPSRSPTARSDVLEMENRVRGEIRAGRTLLAGHRAVPLGEGALMGEPGAVVRVTLNGEPRELPAGATVADLCRAPRRPGRPCAVEVNREIVPRSAHARAALRDDDAIEIVGFVGGG
jgi:3-hexulose-6-phosphate synthase/6-phospho-3-hexuloisomerase